MKPKEAAKLQIIIMAVGFVITLLGYISKTIFIVGLVLMASSLVPHFLWYRCPSCKKVLDGGDYCKFCGEKIEK